MDTSIPLANGEYLLERFAGKGGWTYAMIPEILPEKSNPFGWVRVKGNIDGHEISQFHLMPMGNGHLFLPLNAAVRKAIRKKAGDRVLVQLYRDDSPFEIPEEFATCLSDYPEANRIFSELPEGKKREIVNHIYRSKQPDTRIRRMVQAITVLEKEK